MTKRADVLLQGLSERKTERDHWEFATLLLDQLGEDILFEIVTEAFAYAVAYDDTAAIRMLNELAARIDMLKEATRQPN